MALMSTKEAVTAFYRDRLKNDPEIMFSWFVDGARISINGSGIARQQGFELIPTRPSQDDPQSLDELASFLSAWRWHGVEILALPVDDDLAITRVVVDIENTETGHRERTELCEHFVFNGERFTSLIQFLDTLLSQEMQAAS